MQAALFEQAGVAEDVLTIRDIPSPVPAPGEVLIRVAARPIQPADYLFIGGHYRLKPVFPQVAGLEGVGTIVACGPGVESSRAGERVAFRHAGAWAELAVAPESRIYPVPETISDDVACQFALNPLTAWGLLAESDLAEASRVLITAGRSTVARLLTKLARRRGLNTTLLVREGNGYSALDGVNNSLIAHRVSVANTLQALGGDGHFSAIFDPVGGLDSLALMDALKPRGQLISYGILDDTDITLKASRILFGNLTWRGFGIDSWLNHATPTQLKTAQQELWEMLSINPDLLPVIRRFALSDTLQAVRTAREKHMPGKVVIAN